MMKNWILFIVLVLVWGCSNSPETPIANTEKLSTLPHDDHSYANLQQIRTKHLHLDLEVDFKAQTIYGVARHQMINKGADTAIFDVKGLLIQKVTIGNTKREHEKETDFTIGPMDKDSIIGQALLVNVDSNTTFVNIYYQTTKASAALDWLDTTLTSSKTKPFLYTQGQAILTRTWIPLQDSPSNRITYSADVTVPLDLLALMSAKNPTSLNADGMYHFEMPYAIPSYLIALAVGDIGFTDLGSGCGVYAEKELLQQCAKEFEDLPKMMEVANNLYGKYRWGRYDVLVLPYSFPFGGMENPMLTFANPTLLTGDKSLVSVLAHELAHSWSGNLVTNHSWSDLWLNEGTTVYFEQRIMEALSGKEVSDIMALIEFDELQNALEEIQNSKHPEDSKLHLELVGRDPDLALSDVAYVKGAFFFKTLEQKVGRAALDQFLKNYFAHFAFQTIDAETFIDYLEQHLLNPKQIDFNYRQWIFEAGLPKNCMQIVSPRLDSMKDFAKQYNAGINPFKPKFQYKWIRKNGKRKKVKIDLTIHYHDRIIQEWQIFIRNLSTKTSLVKMRQLDHDLHFSASQNSEVLKEWFVLAAQTSYALEIKPALEHFLVKVGRRKYLMPIYEALNSNPKTKQMAKDIFNKAKENYHSVSRSSVASLLKT